ncbi:hypothetical protein J6590_087738, partial [Homalodisca vitripennis]
MPSTSVKEEEVGGLIRLPGVFRSTDVNGSKSFSADVIENLKVWDDFHLLLPRSLELRLVLRSE